MTWKARSRLTNSERRAGILPALFIAAALPGCASVPQEVRHYGDDAHSIELTATPFYPQQRYQCGPAALMTVLVQSGADVSLPDLVDRVYLPRRHGSLQTEMLAASRAAGRVPYRIDPSLRAIIAELNAGRSVLVLQNLGTSWIPRWHYAVVVGVDPVADRVALRSGTDRRRSTKTQTFLRSWRRSDYWAFVVLRPGELPAQVDRLRYFDALAGMEQTGHIREAHAGWQMALERWPDDAIALFGLANAELARSEFGMAERLYRELLEQNPDAIPARNNLAYALARQGKTAQAVDEIQLALTLAGDDDLLRRELEDTLADIQ